MLPKLIKVMLLSFLISQPINGNQQKCNYCSKVIQTKYIIFESNNYHELCYQDSVQLKCDFCDKNIAKEYTTFNNKSYHENCFKKNIQLKCDFCFGVIDDIYTKKENQKFHKNCYTNNILEKCDVCSNPLEGEFLIDFWKNKYHSYHQSKLPKCDSCNRLISKQLTNGGYEIDKNREVCSLCFSSIINKEEQIVGLDIEVRRLLKMAGIIGLPKVPITLVVDQKELENYSNQKNANMKGFTYYNRVILKGMKIREETHIYILSNMHSAAFKAVLAHELLHVYLFLNDYELPSDITEGFCNLGSQLIFTTINTNLSNYFLKSMYQNKDPDYGIGFLKMNKILEEQGWKRLLKQLKNIK